MPVWEQQVRLYGIGVLLSFGWVLSSPSPGALFSLTDAPNNDVVYVTFGFIAIGAIKGLLGGWIIVRFNSIVKGMVDSGAVMVISTVVGVTLGLVTVSYVPVIAIGGALLAGGCFMAYKELGQGKYEYDALEAQSPTSSINRAARGSMRLKLRAGLLMGILLLGALAQNAYWRDVFSYNADRKNIPQVFKNNSLVVVTYTSSINSGFCRTMRSMLVNNLTVFVAGGNVGAPAFSWRNRLQNYRNITQHFQSLNADTVIAFTDAYDVLAQQNASYIVQEFKKFKAGVVYSAEKNCWPFVLDDKAKTEQCPRYPSNKRVAELYAKKEGGMDVRWPNAGIMICKAQSCNRVLRIALESKLKYFADDDQAIVHEACLLHGKTCQLDYYSRLAQSMWSSVGDTEKTFFENGGQRWKNNVTQTVPAFVHFNGDKGPIVPMDSYSGLNISSLAGHWIHFENGTVRTFPDLCSGLL